MAITVLTEQTAVEVGKRYLVQCAGIQLRSGAAPKYVPIIGIEHKDPAFGAYHSHYHIDGRFADYTTDKNGRTNFVIWTEKVDKNFEYPLFVGLEKRVRKCKRLTTGVTPPLKPDPVLGEGRYMKWYRDQIGKSCAGKKCPHMGAIMHEHGGRLVCPLHNLQGCTTTETIIEPIEL